MATVLLIEDTPHFAEQMTKAARSCGHDVTCIAGVEKLLPDAVLACDGETVVGLAGIDVALVDGELRGTFPGWKLVPMFLGCGIVCVGIASGTRCNELLSYAGAIRTLPKDEVIEALHSGRLDLDVLTSPISWTGTAVEPVRCTYPAATAQHTECVQT